MHCLEARVHDFDWTRHSVLDGDWDCCTVGKWIQLFNVLIFCYSAFKVKLLDVLIGPSLALIYSTQIPVKNGVPPKIAAVHHCGALAPETPYLTNPVGKSLCCDDMFRRVDLPHTRRSYELILPNHVSPVTWNYPQNKLGLRGTSYMYHTRSHSSTH